MIEITYKSEYIVGTRDNRSKYFCSFLSHKYCWYYLSVSLYLSPFLLLSRSLSLSVVFSFFRVLSLSACALRCIRRTELKAMKRSHFLLILSVPLSASLFFIQAINVDILVFILHLGYKSRCLLIQSSFLLSNSLHPGQDRTLPLILFSFNDTIFIFHLLTSIFSCLYAGKTTVQTWANEVKTMPQFPDR